MKERLTEQAAGNRDIDRKLNRIRAYRYNFELEMMLVAYPFGQYPMIG
jgi:hypothetical protein